ncbi:cystathionine gamma-synthase 1, chloroplastic-like, partial [Pyrus communis]|uniref:cystathionine gamma-synthase 1, chloroplastic-like n=1 Tax=Pyrus communis TaxID=23211 RepID=UPI0035C07ECC
MPSDGNKEEEEGDGEEKRATSFEYGRYGNPTTVVVEGKISGSMKLISEIRTLHHILGGALNPNAAYLIIRGMKTLHLLVQQQTSTALRMAKILEAHPKVAHAYYPGLPSHPEHLLAKRRMTGFGGVVNFEIDGDLMRTIKFVDARKIPCIA